jgi:predicted DNA-binding protein (UPF0251 family)/predicted Fe-Mo cluster-binding NifX family protein
MTETKGGADVARPQRCRRICAEPAYDSFAPDGVPTGGQVILTVDEYEAIRLIDLEQRSHEQCAAQMEISRTTVTEIYETARRKIADCIVNGKPLVIAGGQYRLCDGTAAGCCRGLCRRSENQNKKPVIRKGVTEMRIAVTYENGEVFQHFGHTQQFKLYDVENGQIVRQQIADTDGQGHGALAGFLSAAGADVLICGGIGGGAQSALAEAGIKLLGGVSGSADDALHAYLAGELHFDPNVHCEHHGHGGEHSCGEHACGADKHGCSGSDGNCR